VGRRFDTVSFLSDLGPGSDTVGVVRAIIRDAAPHATVIDLTHAIAPYDVRGGSLALARAIGYVPSGVILAAVDPATDRPYVAIEIADGAGILVGPDNGLLAPAAAMAGGAERAVVLSATAHHLVSPGSRLAVRDVLAPAASLLCNGVDLADLGDLVAAESLLPAFIPLPQEGADGAVVGEVLWVNHLGDCQLNVGPDDLGIDAAAAGTTIKVQVTVGSGTEAVVRVAEWHGTNHTSPASTGAIAAAIDPYGMVALVAGRRSAADELRLATGEHVTLQVLAGGSAPVAASPVTLRPGPPR
jgi:S-adenosyl-L-methionine hydrolase (adenosine-forming)